jgi:hypothetical protein
MAAQGFWMRLLCICAKEDGYLLISGAKPTDEDLAFVTRQPVEMVGAWVAELERRGVFSRDRRGVIYSRRMVADLKLAAKNRANGKKGGNPSLRKDDGNPPSDNPPDNPPVKADKEEKREESSVSNETGAEAPSEDDRLIEGLRALSDPKKRAWDIARFVLNKRAGLNASRAGEIIGKWLRDHKLTPDELWEISEAAWKAGTRAPIPYMTQAAREAVVRRSTVDAPSERQQRAWMEDFVAKPNSWKRSDRGPKPGEDGCRIDAAIQLAHGVTPFGSAVLPFPPQQAGAAA